jgi:hypothetical protein
MKRKPGPVATIPATVKITRAAVYTGKSSEEGSDALPGLMERVLVGGGNRRRLSPGGPAPSAA